VYWARGITWGYVDGALARLLKPLPQLATRQSVTARPAFEHPARPRPHPSAGNSDALGGHAVLNPFEVFRESDTVLRGQLNALDAGQLRNIVREYGISNMDGAQLSALSRDELIAMIIAAAERRAA
jgi:hypothetical protein